MTTPSDKATVPPTLLLADDSVTIQRVIELTFADEDVRVEAVGDGDQAIARIEERPPDIVLADVTMPGKTGYEVAHYIKHSERLAHIPVLLLTGAFEPVDQLKIAEAGCDGVLAKPFEPQFVIGRVKELLGRSLGKPSPSTRQATPSPASAVAPPVEVPEPPRMPKPWSPPEARDDAATASSSLTDYLDELDAALANPSAMRTETSGAGSATLDRSDSRAADELEATIDAWDVALQLGHDDVRSPSSAAAHSDVVLTLTEALASASPESSKAALQALAEAFAALLAAGQHPSAPVRSQPPVVTEELIEQVVGRVLARLSDRVVRETVADLVSTVAERLVREEIERIKASVK